MARGICNKLLSFKLFSVCCLDSGLSVFYYWLWIMQNQHGVRPKKTLRMNVKTLFIFQHHHFIRVSHLASYSKNSLPSKRHKRG